MTNEESVLEEAMDNLREAAQRIRATQNVMHARSMTEEVNYTACCDEDGPHGNMDG